MSVIEQAKQILAELRDPPLMRDYTGGYTSYVDARFCPDCLGIDGEHEEGCLYMRAAEVIEALLRELGVEV